MVQDALHSVRGLSRRDGTWVASWHYGIYGAVIDTAGAATVALRYRWTGREYDVETGFYYFRARYYDPAAQRFVQEDPVGFRGRRQSVCLRRWEPNEWAGSRRVAVQLGAICYEPKPAMHREFLWRTGRIH